MREMDQMTNGKGKFFLFSSWWPFYWTWIFKSTILHFFVACLVDTNYVINCNVKQTIAP